MDSSVRKRRAWKHRSEFSDLPADLCHHADLFIKLCDRNELRMRQVVEDLQDISAKLQRLHSRSEKCSVVGTVTAAVGLGAVVAVFIAQVTGGLSLAVTAGAGYVAAAAAVVTLRAKQFTTEEERVKKIKEFLEIVTVLQSELENIMELCEDLQREADGTETESSISLTNNILQPFLTMAKLRSSITAGCVTELTDQCENVFDQFRSMKRKLEEFRGRKDTENIQREVE